MSERRLGEQLYRLDFVHAGSVGPRDLLIIVDQFQAYTFGVILPANEGNVRNHAVGVLRVAGDYSNTLLAAGEGDGVLLVGVVGDDWSINERHVVRIGKKVAFLLPDDHELMTSEVKSVSVIKASDRP